MKRTCMTCGRETILAREIDNVPRIVDAKPSDAPVTPADYARWLEKTVVLIGNLDNQPSALWGIHPDGDRLPWGTVIEPGAPRYRRHECRQED